jgi:hypothetical protein
MRWTKRGLIYAPRGEFEWNKSHAAVPTVDVINGRKWRIYYASRDWQNRSHTSYIEVDAEDPQRVLYEHPEPILPLGKRGTFDDCGIMPSWVVSIGQATRYLYYIGWTLRRTVPYHNSVGLAISQDGGKTFTKFSEGPLLGPSPTEPYFTGSSCVLLDGQVWKIWYLSCTKWEVFDGRPEPFYHIKYAESADGIHWRRDGQVAIELKSLNEAGIARPSVLREDGRYRMWYSYRNLRGYRTEPENSYRIGYAESSNGIRWQRMDDSAGIDVSDHGWDSQMIAYAHIITVGARKIMVYNGNAFGASGLGYAVLEGSL